MNLKKIKTYYSQKLRQHGPVAAGADWNSEASQQLRFQQLLKVLPSEPDAAFSLLDYGCGYGALYAFLKQSGRKSIDYQGFDISAEMLKAARGAFPEARWTEKKEELQPADYVLASGIFNVRLECPDKEWEDHIRNTLQDMHGLSRRGFAFNILTSYSDPPFRKDYLYYAQPEYWFGYCKQHFSRQVALLHDYELYEFTVLVRKG
jgi:SAM-dependent methyltransferase